MICPSCSMRPALQPLTGGGNAAVRASEGARMLTSGVETGLSFNSGLVLASPQQPFLPSICRDGKCRIVAQQRKQALACVQGGEGDLEDGYDEGVRHAETPELAREALADCAVLIFKGQARLATYFISCSRS